MCRVQEANGVAVGCEAIRYAKWKLSVCNNKCVKEPPHFISPVLGLCCAGYAVYQRVSVQNTKCAGSHPTH